ncbi:MAG: PTS sugar transporter subunit IIA [Lachnospiraceae bacterium]|nr:PTS sugar transporter subunit IIA [Lachnospiraceae bacterium]
MNLLQRENVQICSSAADWREAIRSSCRLLEEHGYIEERYKEEIIGNLEKMGPYILLAENIALPHARPEQGAIRTQLGVTLFREPVVFENGEGVQLFITLAAADSESHLEVLMQISELLSDEEQVERMIHSTDEDELFHFF